MKGNLLQSQAEARRKSMQPGIVYNTFLNLNKGKSYNGLGNIQFTLTGLDDVFLDYSGKSVEKLIVNGTDLTSRIEELWKEQKINLPQESLKIGENTLTIQYSNEYYTDGSGVHTYTDMEGNQYLYVQSEPYWTNRVYPIFDQPDLKGYKNYTIFAPSDWVIVSNENTNRKMTVAEYTAATDNNDFDKMVLEMQENDLKEGAEKIVHDFNKTKLISTYLFAFVAGPYQSVSYDGFDGESVPMTIYARKSLFQYANRDKVEIFLYIKRGITFYEEFFQTKYPFEKYDFVFCPEYTVGAMEYPGVITYTERLIFKDTPTLAQVTVRGMVSAHELAHMWFGNLVTMKWWNDLWLNESFADFVCYVNMAGIHPDLPFKTSDAWTKFFLRKSWGYNTDMAVTTHPIAGEVLSTDAAETIFDGITYSKGASVLKQLLLLVGREQFSKNVGRYFNKYKWSNASLEDFLAEMAVREEPIDDEAYDIKKFNEDWINTSCCNELQAEWDPSKQGKSVLRIRQTPVLPQHPTLRYHVIKIGFFDENGKVAHVQKAIVRKQEWTEIEFKNKNYKAVLLNYEDWDFVKVTLEEHSSKFFLENMNKLENPLDRAMVVKMIFNLVKDAKMKSSDFIRQLGDDFLENSMVNSEYLSLICDHFNSALHSYTPSTHIDAEADYLVERFTALLPKAQDKEIKKILKTALLNSTITDEAIDKLKLVLEDNNPQLADLDLTIDEKWRVVVKINYSGRYNATQKKIFTDAFAHADTSESKKHPLLIIGGLTNDKQKMVELWKEYTNPKREMSYTELGQSIAGFAHSKKPIALRKEYINRFFVDCLEIMRNDSSQVAKQFFGHGFPETDNLQFLIDALDNMLAGLNEDQRLFRTMIMSKQDELRKKMKAYKLFE